MKFLLRMNVTALASVRNLETLQGIQFNYHLKLPREPPVQGGGTQVYHSIKYHQPSCCTGEKPDPLFWDAQSPQLSSITTFLNHSPVSVLTADVLFQVLTFSHLDNWPCPSPPSLLSTVRLPHCGQCFLFHFPAKCILHFHALGQI